MSHTFVKVESTREKNRVSERKNKHKIPNVLEGKNEDISECSLQANGFKYQ